MINLSRILVLLAGGAEYLSHQMGDKEVGLVLTAASLLLAALAKPGALLPAKWTAAIAAVFKAKTDQPPAQ